jgi:hypothetical protein
MEIDCKARRAADAILCRPIAKPFERLVADMDQIQT